MKLGIWLVRRQAEPLGIFLQQKLSAELLSSSKHPEKSGKSQFAELFFEYAPWVLVMTTGIAVRYLEGLPQDKHSDPGVVVLDEGARFAVSLLAGHEGKANLLAHHIATLTGAIPVITTATETLKPIVIGIGCRKGVASDHIEEAVSQALRHIGRSFQEVREIATIDLKEKEPGLRQWCARREFPLHGIKRELLAIRPWVTRSSHWVQQNLGVAGVCEPCALLASIRGELILRKTTCKGVAVAIVEDPVFIPK